MNQEQLKSVLHYDAPTGVFRWRHGGKSHAGKRLPWAVAGTPHNFGYIVIGINRKRYLAHRLAWLYVYGEMPSKVIDHKNGNRDDNRIENLRDVSHQINCQNQRGVGSRNTSGYLGVSWRKDKNVWRASINVNGRMKSLGVYKTPEEAHKAFLAAKRQLHEGNTL